MATITRPTAGYTPSNPITNTTKYQVDSAATAPKVAISSVKMDGDINKAFDTLTNHDNTLADHETRIDTLEGTTYGTVTSVGVTMPAEFSVASSPITTSGTIAVTKATQVKNRVYSGPASGSDAAPTFRALVAADLGTGTADATTYFAGDMTFKTLSCIGMAIATNPSVGTCSTAIPLDNTIPQNTEGTEVLTVTYTPKSTSSTLVVEAQFYAAGSGAEHLAALFRDSNADAFAASVTAGVTGGYIAQSICGKVTSGATTATTFKLRVGPTSGTIYVNGDAGGSARFGGVSSSTLKVSEYI